MLRLGRYDFNKLLEHDSFCLQEKEYVNKKRNVCSNYVHHVNKTIIFPTWFRNTVAHFWLELLERIKFYVRVDKKIRLDSWTDNYWP